MKKRILAVDDDLDILRIEKKVLEREGYEVLTAENAKEAMSIIEEKDFDLILLDVMMPDMNGFELGRWIRTRMPARRIPIVFLTAKGDADSFREGFRSGGAIYMMKPFTSGQLAKTVLSVIGN